MLIIVQTLLGQICDRLTSGEAIVKKDFNFSFYTIKSAMKSENSSDKLDIKPGQIVLYMV